VQELRRSLPGIAVLVLTGLADEDRGSAAVGAGAQDYLVKGQVDGHLLTRAIRYAVERRRAEAELRRLYAAELQAAENARLERGLLPQPHVTDPRLAVLARYRPGGDALLDGDFYDVVETADGTLHMLVGDVCGHGPDGERLGVEGVLDLARGVEGDDDTGRLVDHLIERARELHGEPLPDDVAVLVLERRA
jgi:hypothetical protein